MILYVRLYGILLMVRAGRAHKTIESPKEPYQHITEALR
jgi:hypothetical protein